MQKLGIDVSTWQGDIDWKKVKDSGIQFAILRCGYGMNYTDNDDSTFDRNAKECERLGIPYGVYLYSYATNVEKAKSEAAHTLRLLKDRKLEYPVYLDLEDKTVASIGSEQILVNTKVYVDTVRAAGYCVGIYANLNWWNNYLTDSWYDECPRWVAQYNTECQYKKEYGIWQYSSSGSVSGINGRVDMNYAYVDYPKLISDLAKDEEEIPPATSVSTPKTIDELAKEVIDGKWGNGQDRIDKLTKSGFDAEAVQNRVNELLTVKSVDELAKEVIDGKWGDGKDRVDRLTKAGYNAEVVQNRVNDMLTPKKSIDELAREVIRGEWGNGQDRVNRLVKAGYDATVVQKRVNELL